MLCLLDNSAWVFDAYKRPLEEVLGEPIWAILHDRQTEEALVEEIVSAKPDVLLLDAQLANELEGPDLLKTLLRELPELRCIGFSSDDGYKEAFLKAGAVGFVHKRANNAWQVVRDMEPLLKRSS